MLAGVLTGTILALPLTTFKAQGMGKKVIMVDLIALNESHDEPNIMMVPYHYRESRALPEIVAWWHHDPERSSHY